MLSTAMLRVVFVPGGNLQELRHPLFQFVHQIVLNSVPPPPRPCPVPLIINESRGS